MEDKGVATLDRALAILATFSEAEPLLSLAELSRRTGLYKSTLLRLLASLQHWHFVVQRQDGQYHVGPAALHLARLYQRSIRPAELVHEAIVAVAAEVVENVNFYVRRGEARVCVDCVPSPHAIRHHTLVGEIFPLQRGAAGRVLCAFSDDLATPSLEPVRKAFACVSHGEYVENLSAVSVPVFGTGNQCEGAIAVTGLSARFTEERVDFFVRQLRRASLKLSRALGADNALLQQLESVLDAPVPPTPITA
ncbi:MAG: IclR family transcriptional regulator [Pigmentiphaga sp.]|uniref:IclR family transcriptional regulator n=1 Tax=Pigmentiphaga sp. TaxID=1977564 RepID=UPI0029BD51C6|nr:IclR family transcriptional regulator [Pigmentiphaga sp.]MDX3906500.1 IclR family transcriptional regulator [Pigmentiphaga sp.]